MMSRSSASGSRLASANRSFGSDDEGSAVERRPAGSDSRLRVPQSTSFDSRYRNSTKESTISRERRRSKEATELGSSGRTSSKMRQPSKESNSSMRYGSKES